jgi:uncharacterized protein
VRPSPARTALALASAAGITVALAVAGGPATAAPSTSPVISEAYGGGGNSGAPLKNDFIELQNLGTTDAALTGYSVQYISASPGATTTWQVTPLSGTAPHGGHFLIGEAAGANTAAADLPTPDNTGSINMGSTAGTVALVHSTSALTCKTTADCAADTSIVDLVGWGGAVVHEGTAAAATTNATSTQRAASRADTDDNSADFTSAAPTPANAGTGGGTGDQPGPLRIHDIQGSSWISPQVGNTVTNVPGIVTALRTGSSKGYWIQDPNPDSDPATSEGVFVFTSTAPSVAVGDSVTVNGTVSEFRPGGSGGTTNLTTTELTAPAVTVLAHGAPLPAPTLVGTGGRVPPGTVIEDDATGDVETSGTFDPASDGIDFWESLESMRVEIDDAAVVGPRSAFGEIPVVPPGSTTRTSRGGIVLQAGDTNPERVLLDDALAATPVVDVGDTLAGATVGVLSYSFGNVKLLVTATPTVTHGGLTAETTAAPTAGELSVATFNVENLDPTDPQSKFDGLAAGIVRNLRAPDLVALEEIQDDNGPTDNGVVAADQTMTKLINAITAAGGPTYQYRQVDPVNDADGGEPGGNIRQVFLFRTDRGLSFVDRPGATATTADSVVNTGGVPSLAFSPGRIDPTNPAFDASRKPLAGEFRWNGTTFFAIANHFNSKGGDDPLFGHLQPPAAPSETQRHEQASVVRGFVDQILAVDPDAPVIVLGDLNDFDFSRTADILTSGGALVDLPRTLPVAERYTFDFEGNAQVLDHILLSPSLAARPFGYDIVHMNSEFAAQLSDHDPQVVRIAM